MADESSALSLHEPPNEADYDLIHDAVMETQRGRWFLHEYAKRNRNADTGMLLAAIERIETMLRMQPAIPQPPAPASPLTDLRESLDQTKENPDAIKPDGGHQGKSADFDIIATSLKAAIAQMHAAIGPMRDTAYAMREEGVADRFSNSIEGCASDLSVGCRELDQAATGIVELLRDLAGRLEALTASGAEAVAPAPVAAPAPSVEPAASVASVPSAAEPVPSPVEHAIPGFEPAPATDEPATEMRAPRAEALTLDPLMPASDGAIEAPAVPHERVELAHAPTGLALELGLDVDLFVRTESATFLPDPYLPDPDESVSARHADKQDRASETAARLPLPDFAATPIDGPADILLEPVAPAETPPAASMPPEALALLKSSAPMRRQASDALAPIMALSDDEKIALFT